MCLSLLLGGSSAEQQRQVQVIINLRAKEKDQGEFQVFLCICDALLCSAVTSVFWHIRMALLVRLEVVHLPCNLPLRGAVDA